MSTGTDFLANLQKKTVKNTVQQKQQKRVNASAVDVSALLEAALGKKKPVEAVADVRQSTDAATASFLTLADTHQGRSTQQKPKNASDKKQTPQKSKDIVDAGITALIQKALDAKKVMAEPDIAERLQSTVWRVSLRSSSHRKNRRITSSFRRRPSGLPKRKPEPLMWQLTSAFLRT